MSVYLIQLLFHCLYGVYLQLCDRFGKYSSYQNICLLCRLGRYSSYQYICLLCRPLQHLYGVNCFGRMSIVYWGMGISNGENEEISF